MPAAWRARRGPGLGQQHQLAVLYHQVAQGGEQVDAVLGTARDQVEVPQGDPYSGIGSDQTVELGQVVGGDRQVHPMPEPGQNLLEQATPTDRRALLQVDLDERREMLGLQVIQQGAPGGIAPDQQVDRLAPAPGNARAGSALRSGGVPPCPAQPRRP